MHDHGVACPPTMGITWKGAVLSGMLSLHEHAVGLRVLRQLPLDTLGEYSTTTRHSSLADASSNKVDIDCTGGLGFGNAGFDVPCLT